MVSINLARLIAKVSGDGHLSNRQVMYFNTCPELIEEFESDLKIVFGNVRFSKGKMNSGVTYISVSGKDTANEFKKYLQSYNSNDIYIPPEIINSNINIVKEYLRAFYDDEGVCFFTP